MKKHTSFFAGFLAALLVCVCATTALAASGNISFNGAEVRIGGYTIFRKNEQLTTEKGSAIPSTILFTDSLGGTTCYVPIDAFVKSMDMSAKWLTPVTPGNQTVAVSPSIELQAYGLSLDSEGSVCNNMLEEIAPVPDAAGKKLLDAKQYQQKDGEAVACALTPVKGSGDYVSVTITNNGQRMLKFGLGIQRKSGVNETIVTQIPAGATVTRTVKVLDAQAVSENPIFVSLKSASEYIPNVDATIAAVQFKTTPKQQTPAA